MATGNLATTQLHHQPKPTASQLYRDAFNILKTLPVTCIATLAVVLLIDQVAAFATPAAEKAITLILGQDRADQPLPTILDRRGNHGPLATAIVTTLRNTLIFLPLTAIAPWYIAQTYQRSRPHPKQLFGVIAASYLPLVALAIVVQALWTTMHLDWWHEGTAGSRAMAARGLLFAIFSIAAFIAVMVALVRWIAAPAFVLSGAKANPWSALAQSWQATRGIDIAIFGGFVIATLSFAPMTLIFFALPNLPEPIRGILVWIWFAAIGLLVLAFIASIYNIATPNQ